MNFSKVKIVMGREFAIRVKKKSFILTTLLTPILFAALMIIPSVIMMTGSDDVQKIMVVDESGIVGNSLNNSKTIEYQFTDRTDIDELKKNFNDLGVDAVVVISPLDQSNNVKVDTYSNKQLNMEVKNSVANSANKALENYKLKNYDIENLDQILKDVKSDVKVSTYTLSEDGKEKKSMVEISMALSYIMSFFIYIFVLMFGNMVMRSVIDEKSNRIVEVIVSSVKPFELMIGKILGVASVAVTQFLIWIVLTLVLVMGFNVVSGSNILKSIDDNSQITEMATAQPGMGDVAKLAQAGESEIGGVMSALSAIDFPYIIGCFLIYFVLGYLLYAAMFAAVGSAVDNEADTQQLVMPVTMPLILGLFIMLHTFQHPDSALSFWASIIPFTSPMVMLARIPFEGGVPTWELALSMGLLLLTFLLVTYLSGKIYRVGILMYGKKASWKDLMKWIKY